MSISNETMAYVSHLLYDKIEQVEGSINSLKMTKEMGQLIGSKLCKDFDGSQFDELAGLKLEEALDGYNTLITVKEDLIEKLEGYEAISLLIEKARDLHKSFQRAKPFSQEEKEALLNVAELLE